MQVRIFSEARDRTGGAANTTHKRPVVAKRKRGATKSVGEAEKGDTDKPQDQSQTPTKQDSAIASDSMEMPSTIQESKDIKAYPPRIAEFTLALYPKAARISTNTGSRTTMIERTGAELESSYVGDHTYLNQTGVVSSPQNITQRYVPPPIISDGCNVPIHAQPSCNNIHSIDIMDSLSHDLFRKVSKGDVRNVWSVLQTNKRRRIQVQWDLKRVPFVMKTLRWPRDYIRQTYVLQQKEAVALDYLSNAPGTTSLYGFCGMASLTGYANEGNLADFLKRRLKISKNVSPAEFLAIAARLAAAVAGMQGREWSIMGSGYQVANATLQAIHRDIGASNVLLNQGPRRLDVRIDDFNKAYVLRRWDRKSSSKRMCTYRERYICGEDGRRPDTRSPEECQGNRSLTHKVDTFGLGTVFFYLLTQNRVHNLNSDSPGPAEEHVEWYRERVRKGETPEIPQTIASKSNRAVMAIIEGMRMAMVPDPIQRPSALEIAQYLDGQYWKYVEVSMKNQTIRQAVQDRIRERTNKEK